MDPNGHSIPALWQEARNTDGRVYYYNVQTKATQWTKPQELMTPVEVCVNTTLLIVSSTDIFLACAGESTMERIHH